MDINIGSKIIGIGLTVVHDYSLFSLHSETVSLYLLMQYLSSKSNNLFRFSFSLSFSSSNIVILRRDFIPQFNAINSLIS